MENQTQVSHAFHRPLKIPRRDFHISTAPAMTVISLNQETKKRQERKSAAARPPHPNPFQDHSVWETEPGFRIILGLENAQPARTIYE
jgi:hypothetical protein